MFIPECNDDGTYSQVTTLLGTCHPGGEGGGRQEGGQLAEQRPGCPGRPPIRTAEVSPQGALCAQRGAEHVSAPPGSVQLCCPRPPVVA